MPGIEKGTFVHTNSAFSLPGIICVSVCVVMVVYLRGGECVLLFLSVYRL